MLSPELIVGAGCGKNNPLSSESKTGLTPISQFDRACVDHQKN
jgi:hypothetical protein